MLIEDLKASAVMGNDHTAFRVDWMPFAGLKESGYGLAAYLTRMKICKSKRCWGLNQKNFN
ncbi:MAG: hypothetical protein CM1200mP40_10190 [Gammaproteobacteria bacterium]|nr:MAG: hypothetical protein CM1200mP40_10190 [Gammaproteobacteria bacterium]